VLFVLLQNKQLSASQIAKESGIIRNSIYDILKDFVERGERFREMVNQL